jgi:hypothetical protein
MIAILIPVLGRPKLARPLAKNIHRATTGPHRILFLCSPDDPAVGAYRQTEEELLVVPWSAGHGDWAKKINYGINCTDEPFLLFGATDLHFHPDWDTQVLRVAEETGAGVIGTNDLGNRMVMRGKHSTHPVVRRTYIEEYGTIDEPGKALHEGYQHQWVDTELVETAKHRGQWAFARHSIVEHMHPFWHKGKMDAVYEKALSTSREDHKLFMKRQPLILSR